MHIQSNFDFVEGVCKTRLTLSYVGYVPQTNRIRGDGLNDIKEDLAFPHCSSRVVDGIDPEDCVSTRGIKMCGT